MRVDRLVIEVTRNCNMRCGHCLRGEPQARRHMTREILYSALRNVSEIGTVTFTGGEPSMRPQAISDFLDICRMRGIYVGSWYIVTNAKRITTRFLETVERLHAFCQDNELSGLEVSNDQYHCAEGGTTYLPYRIEEFGELTGINVGTRLRKIPGYSHFIEPRLIGEGRAKGWGERINEPDKIIYDIDHNGEISVRECDLYVNCKGNVIKGCDWSYKSQDRPDKILCKVDDFTDDVIRAKGEMENDYMEREDEEIDQLRAEVA